MQVTITIPDTITVSKRDGSSVEIESAKVPEDFWADFATEGAQEYTRDSSSAALLDAYRAAHKGDDGDVESRKAWGESNGEAIKAESNTLMQAAVDRMYAGERRIARGGSSDPLDPYRLAFVMSLIRVASRPAELARIADAKTRKALEKLRDGYNAIDSDDQSARREYRLEWAKEHAEVVDAKATEAKAADDKRKAEQAKTVSSLSF